MIVRDLKNEDLTIRSSMKKLRLTALFLLSAVYVFAQPVEFEEARSRAEAFFAGRDAGAGLKAGPLVVVDTLLTWRIPHRAELKSATAVAEPAFYIFNRLDREGFVVISAERRVREVVAWSMTSRMCGIAPQMKPLLDRYAAEIALARELDVTPPGELKGAGMAVEPLLENISWNQSPDPFNTLCPFDEATGRICPAGCVATALAQVLYFYKYPRVGTGSFGYTSPYGYLSADFGKSEYKYEEMADRPWPGVPNPEIAELTYHSAIAVEMEFGPYSSSTFTGQVAGALEKYFKYKKPSLVNRSIYSDEAWTSLIVNEINSRRPVIYSAMDYYDPSVPGDVAGGHAFVVDGYDSSGLFHINWGWGGCSDGYYSLGLLNPSDCASQYTYGESHSVIVGIEPLTPVECLLSVGEEQLIFPVTGGEQVVAVSGNAEWTVTTEAWWIHLVPETGKGDGAFRVEVRANAGFLGRSAVVTLRGCGVTREITVVQDGTCVMEPSQKALEFPVTAGSDTLTIRSTAAWMITSGSSWISVNPGLGNGNEVITVTVASNEGSVERSGFLEITGCSVTRKVAVHQEGSCSLTLSAHSAELGPEQGSTPVKVISNAEWEAYSQEPWISLDPLSGTGDTILTITVTANSEQSKRTGLVTVMGCNTTRTIQVTQQGTCSLEVDPLELEFSPSASDRYVTVSSGTSWKASTAESWMSVTPATGAGTAMLRISVAENTGSSPRKGVVLVAGCSVVYAIAITQRSNCLFEISSMMLDFSYMPASKSLEVTTSSSWKVQSGQSWITVTPKSGSSNSVVRVDVALNSGETSRSGSLTFTGCNYSRVVKVEQGACSIDVSAEKLSFLPEGGSRILEVTSNASWTLTTGAPWVSLSSVQGNRNGSVIVEVEGNDSGSRMGWISLSGCFSPKRVEVVQEALATPAGVTVGEQPRIWPSPAHGKVSLHIPGNAGNGILEIYSSSGQRVRLIPSPGNSVSLEGLTPGLYFFHFHDGEFSLKEKILVR